MKANPTGSSPEACAGTQQGSRSCPVCQAWGGLSSLGSDLGSGSGPRVRPSTVPEAELRSGAALGPETRPGAVPGLRPGPGGVPSSGLESGAVPGPSVVPDTGSASGAILGQKSRLGVDPGSGPIPGVVPILAPGSATVPKPRSGPDVVLSSAPVPGVVPVPGLGSGAVPGPGPGLGPKPGAKLVPGRDSGSVPGPKPEPEIGSKKESGARFKQEAGDEPKPSEPPIAPASAPQQRTQIKPSQAPRQKVLVTGGGGYLGFSLGSSLAQSGISVILLDLRRPQWELVPGTEFVQADVRNEEALYRAVKGVDCVFHVASYGMSGAEKLQKEQIESVNVGGTRVVIDVCIRQRVPRLVYTSTVNVVFGGRPIEQGDEDSVPYFPLEKHMDHYSRTKAIADQLTLMANGTPLPGGGTLRTCVLRPPGIYGPEEQRHLPRVANHIKKRLFMFRFGDRRTRMNWVHVSNLVQAHVLAAEALTEAKGFVASGQAYYINDGESVNLFEWMTPLFEKLGYSPPWIQVPTSLVYLTATVMEYLHLALRPICSLPPLLTRSEVRSVAVTHTFQIAKARAQLGYSPDKFTFSEAVERYVQATSGQPRCSTARALLQLLLALLLLLGLLALALQPLEVTGERL